MDGFELTTDWLRERTAISPDAEALLIDGRRWSFDQLDALVSRLCHLLGDEGIGASDTENRPAHVGVLMSNSLAAAACIYALGRMGAVLVPLNPRLTPPELAWQIERAGCSAVLCTSNLEEAALSATQERIPVRALPHAAAEFDRMLDRFPKAYVPETRGDLSTLQAIVFTSGTTGFPKGALISYANHFWSASGSVMRLGTRPEDRWLACLPLCHVGGLAVLFRSCLYGTAVVLHDGFDTQAMMDSLRAEAITLVSLVPTMLGRLLRAGLTREDAQSLRLILLGGAAAPPSMLAEASAAGLPVAVTYGLTEATTQVATMEPGRVPAKPGSAGKPLTFATIAIVDDTGRDLPRGASGEIVVKGPMVMAGYYNDPAATAEKLRDGRLHTGDIGYLDSDGDLWVLDRRSDLIVSGGENVYPAEVERVLQAHPDVAQACVVGLPHPEWGQQVAAVIVPRRPGQLDEDALLAFSREQLAGYKQPRAVYVVDQLPQTGSGKVNRRAALEQLTMRPGTS